MREVLTDPAFLQDRLDAVGGSRGELVSREQDEHITTVVLRHTVPAGTLPSFVRAVLPGDLAINRTERWNGSGCRVHSVVEGAPGEITGEMWLDPDPAGCVLSMQLEAKVSLPLIGGKVEKTITENVARLLATEYEFTIQWLRSSAAPGQDL